MGEEEQVDMESLSWAWAFDCPAMAAVTFLATSSAKLVSAFFWFLCFFAGEVVAPLPVFFLFLGSETLSSGLPFLLDSLVTSKFRRRCRLSAFPPELSPRLEAEFC